MIIIQLAVCLYLPPDIQPPLHLKVTKIIQQCSSVISKSGPSHWISAGYINMQLGVEGAQACT